MTSRRDVTGMMMNVLGKMAVWQQPLSGEWIVMIQPQGGAP